MSESQNLNCVAEFLAERDVPELSIAALDGTVDILVLLGSSLIGPTYLAAQAMKAGIAKRLLISGGIGHSTQYLRDSITSNSEYTDISTENRAEANILHDVLTRHLGVDPQKIIIENTSTNCGTNAEESRKALDKLGLPIKRMILLQDPTMQRRSQACFERAWQDKPKTQILSFAPFTPRTIEVNGELNVTGDQYPIWSFERFVSLVLGEIPRLRDDKQGYGPKGRNYFNHIDIPDAVLAAYEQIAQTYAESLREIPNTTD